MAEHKLLNEIINNQDIPSPDISPIRQRYKASLRSENNKASENSSQNKSPEKKNRSIRFTDECNLKKYFYLYF